MQLELDAVPTEVRVSARLVDVSALTPTYREEFAEIVSFDYSASEQISLEVTPAATQTLQLSQFAEQADIILFVGASYPVGGISWTFWITTEPDKQ